MIQQYEIQLPKFKRGFHLITHLIIKEIKNMPQNGLMNIYLKHTSAALSINENADPSVRVDFETIMNNIVPEGKTDYTHTLEGDDDMPAHVKSSLLGTTINVPITNYQLNMGTWQGIYLCEFRNYGGQRTVVITIYS